MLTLRPFFKSLSPMLFIGAVETRKNGPEAVPLHDGSPAAANSSSPIVSNAQASPYATATAIRFAGTTISGSQDKAGTTGSFTIKATHYSSGTTQSILALPDGESVFDVED